MYTVYAFPAYDAGNDWYQWSKVLYPQRNGAYRIAESACMGVAWPWLLMDEYMHKSGRERDAFMSRRPGREK